MARSPLHQRNWLSFRALSRVVRAAAIACGMLVMTFMPRLILAADAPTVITNKLVKPVIGSKFDDVLKQPLGLTWADESLRAGLWSLAQARQVSILLDRRVDPETKVSIEIQRVPFRDLIEQLADRPGLGASVVGNTVYVGPRTTTARLRTVVEMQTDLLVTGSTTNKPPLALLQRRSIDWSDLERPADLIVRVSELFGFKVEGLEAVPHDLWPAGSIPNAFPTEMLMLVLAQFDLSVEWQPKGASVRIVSMPQSPQLERTYDGKTKAAELAEDWLAEFPSLRIDVKGTKLLVRGTVEQHEQIAASLKQPRTPRKAPTGNDTKKAVTFTFEIKSAPLLAVMQAVEKQSNYVFKYDADELTAAGVKLDRRLDLKMTKASPAELFHAMFDDARIAFEFDGNTVKLTPAAK